MVFSAPGEASDLAKTGELKAGQQMLKEATGEGHATFLPFRAPASSFFSLFLFSDLLSSALLLSDSSHLCFYMCSYCWKFDF